MNGVVGPWCPGCCPVTGSVIQKRHQVSEEVGVPHHINGDRTAYAGDDEQPGDR
jgi:hypothetical protein